ncbi:MAG: SMC family ATPase [Candidatus Micrarchaeota archaeon]|nr:SMC family ATPase [Candidatus Micrarchaeota archaeon]
MIESVELRNWKTHGHTELRFQKGVNVLIGVMGAGKSSVMDAISFGLFGTFPSLTHKRVSLGNLISNRPEQKDDSEVRINFTVGEDRYTVTRKITRKEGSTARLDRNGSYVQTQPERVNEEIERLLKLDYDTFSRAIYAEQNQLEYFLDLPKGDRKRQIDNMLGLDLFAKAEENVTSLINTIKSTIAEDEKVLAQIDLESFKEQLGRLSEDKMKSESEATALESLGKTLQSGIRAMEAEFAEMKRSYDTRARLSKEIAELSSRISTLRSESEKISQMGIEERAVTEEHAGKSSRLKAVEESIKELRSREKELSRAVADAEAKLGVLNAKAKERDSINAELSGKELSKIENEASTVEQSIKGQIQQVSSLQSSKRENDRWLSELEKHISNCPVCERELDDSLKSRLVKERKDRTAELENQINSASAALKDRERQRLALSAELDRFKVLKGRLEQFKGLEEQGQGALETAEKGKKALTEMTSSIESANKEREALTKDVNALTIRLDAARRKRSYDEEVLKSAALLEQKNREVTATNVDEKKLYSIQEEMRDKGASLANTTSKIESSKKYVAELDRQISEKTRQISNISVIKDRIEHRRGKISNLNKFKGALVDTEAQLRNRLVSSINTIMQNLWQVLYPYNDYSAVRLNAKKDDYTLEANAINSRASTSEWVDVISIASGGEKSIASLTMRVALAMVIVPNLKWLILDEPTHNIDEQGIGKFIDVLGESLPSIVEQIFIITHDGNLKSIPSARVYQLERDKDKNEPTQALEFQ